jgi:hypothetical protein
MFDPSFRLRPTRLGPSVWLTLLSAVIALVVLLGR